jgi:hypothetical protein
MHRCRDPGDDRIKDFIKMHLARKLLTEFKECPLVVVAFLVEEPVDPILGSSFHRIEREREDDEREQVSDLVLLRSKCIRHRGADQIDKQQVQSRQHPRNHRIEETPLDDKVDIHQAIPENRIAECERQKHHEQHRQQENRRREKDKLVGCAEDVRVHNDEDHCQHADQDGTDLLFPQPVHPGEVRNDEDDQPTDKERRGSVPDHILEEQRKHPLPAEKEPQHVWDDGEYRKDIHQPPQPDGVKCLSVHRKAEEEEYERRKSKNPANDERNAIGVIDDR